MSIVAMVAHLSYCWAFFPSVCVFVDISILELLRAQFFTDFDQILMRLRNVVASTPIFVRQTGSTLPILGVCGFRYRQFSGSGDHIFQQISIQSHVRIKFSNADFVLYSIVHETKNRNRVL